MFLIRCLCLLFVLPLLTIHADAQANAWNRKISDIRLVHPPGTPPGYYVVTAEVAIEGVTAPPGTLTLDCLLYVNGTLLNVVNLPVEPSQGPTVCPGSCSGGCSIAVSFGVPLAGNCSQGGGCHCSAKIDVDLGGINNPALSAVRVVAMPTIGSLPELDTSDDFLDTVVPENNPGTVTCTGDGTGTACPCANNGAIGHGCANSSNAAGGHMSATGFVEAGTTGSDSVVLHVDGMPSGAPLLYFQGTSNAVQIVFGDGNLCTTGSLIRLRVKINVGGASSFPEPGDPSLGATGGVTLGGGSTLYYQAYYRDAATFCTSATFNMTNGISLTWL
ncbi:MAG: hypothetical protein JNL28_17335 [Planctomycetes bacterium]|nr:hypothetical protein [Planctomycetota bacterium]